MQTKVARRPRGKGKGAFVQCSAVTQLYSVKAKKGFMYVCMVYDIEDFVFGFGTTVRS